MQRVWRWAVVALVLGALVAAPSAVGALPTGEADVTAAELLTAVQGSEGVPYSGYAQSTGGVVLPVTDQLGSLADLLGSTATVRTWWRSTEDWRVDTVRPAGQRSLHRTPDGLWRWDYEADRAVLQPVPEPTLRLPREADLLPTELGRRLLSEADPSEVSRLPVQRVAGREAPGLRLVPGQAGSAISAVDVWVDPATGLPLRVVVLARDTARPVVSTSFLDFSDVRPDASTTAFRPPRGSDISSEGPTDLASFADRVDTAPPPATLGGLELRSRESTGLGERAGSVGVYGRGVTELVLAPLPRRATEGLREQLGAAPGAVVDADGVALSVGPLALRLTPPAADGRVYLLTGTVTAPTLAAAARELASGSPR